MNKILLVDDEVDILKSIGGVIQSMGYEVALAKDWKMALSFLNKDKFDLVILDVLMPEMSGIDVLTKIRENPKLKSQKVVFLSVIDPRPADGDRLDKLSPLGYLQKPIEIDEFKKELKGFLKK